MKEMKFRVHSPEHSELIQKRLFELGYKWKGSGVRHTGDKYLFVSSGGLITREPDNEAYFNNDPRPETTLDDLYAVDPYAELKEAYARGEKIELKVGNAWYPLVKAHWESPVDLYRIDKPKTITLEGWSHDGCADRPSKTLVAKNYEVEVRKDGVYHEEVGLVYIDSLKYILDQERREGYVHSNGACVDFITRYKVGCSEFDREEVQKAYDAVKELR